MSSRILWALAFATSLAFAQGRMGGGGMSDMDEGGARSGMGRAGDMGAPIPRAQRQSKLDMIADKLKLNKEQKEQVQSILMSSAQEAAPIRAQLLKGRDAIANAILSGKGDDEIKKAVDAYAGVAAQMTGLETTAFTKIYAMLKPNQQGKGEQAFELMAGIFNQGMAGGGRGMGRGVGR